MSHSEQPLYEASATVLVNEQNPADAGAQPELERRLAARPVCGHAGRARARRHGRRDGRDGGRRARASRRQALLANSSVSANPTADLLTFSVTDPVPANAEKLATAYANAFTVYRRRLDTGRALDRDRGCPPPPGRARRGGPEPIGALPPARRARSRDLEAMQTLEASGASAVVVGRAGGTSQVQPRTTRNVALGILVGIALGIGARVPARGVRHPRALGGRAGRAAGDAAARPRPQAGSAPGRGATRSSPSPSRPAPSAEAFRILKTSIDISQLQHHVGSIMVTSTREGEGKSTTVANLAVTLARSGRHVILVDLDLRHPRIDTFFDLDGQPGLTSVAVGEAELGDALCIVDVHPEPTVADAGTARGRARRRAAARSGRVPVVGASSTDALAALAARCDVRPDRHAADAGRRRRDDDRDPRRRASSSSRA